MTPPPPAKRATWKGACCLLVVAVVGTMVVGVGVVIGGGFAVTRWWGGERKFMEAEHTAWPKPTPLAGLVTRSPGGALVTRAGKHGGDGRGSHSERHDCVHVGPSSCPEALVELTAQDHAACESDWIGCGRTDGQLLHERYGMKLRWLDASRLEVSWTELTGVDANGHRIWGRRAEIRRVDVVRPAAGSCEGVEVHAELVTPPGGSPAP